MLQWLTTLLGSVAGIAPAAEIPSKGIGLSDLAHRRAIIDRSGLGVASPRPAYENNIVWNIGGDVVMEPEDSGKPGANYSNSVVQYRSPRGIHKTGTVWGGK